MSINVTLIGQLLAFALFVWFTKAFVWPPVIQAMRERQQRISDGLAAGERGVQELNKAHEESRRLLDEARRKSSELVAQANKRSSEIQAQAREDARREGERMIETARAEIEQELERARQALRKEVAGIATASAGRILRREIDRKTHESLIDDLVEQM